MLILGSRLIEMPVMGLQTGTSLAKTKRPIVDPSNLTILAYEVYGPLINQHPTLLRIADVRELSNIGLIIDGNDDFIGVSDVINIENIYNLGFNLLGISVVDERGHKLGKVENYRLETKTFSIQQLVVKQGFFKSLSDSELLINRSQITEINNSQIVVKSTAQKITETVNEEKNLSYLNPFRTTKPQIENEGV